MKLFTTRFGRIEIRDDAILTFPSGILGFPDWTRYVMLDHDTDAPFKWLQCVEQPGLAFVILDPALFKDDYAVELSAEVLAEVKGLESDGLTLAVLLTIPSEDPGRITANLRGPLLMNPRTRLCKQLVLTESYPTRYPLFPVSATAPAYQTAAIHETVCPA